jgi:hypothetical protein
VDAAALPGGATQHRADRLFQPFMGVGDHQTHPTQAAFHQAPQERGPEAPVFRGAHVDPQDLALAVERDADRDHRRLTDDTAIDADLVIGRVQPDVRMLAGQRPGPEGLDHRTELRANAGYLRLRDPIQPERLHEVVDLPRRHPVDVRFLDHRQQRLLGPATGLQQRWEVRAGTDLGNRQVHRTDPRVPGADPRPIARRGALVTPLVALSAHQRRDLGLHQGLGEHPHPLAQDIAVLLFEKLANERGQIHPWLGHRRIISVSSSPARENSRNDARWPLACPASAAYRISTTSWDSDQRCRL